MSKDDFPDPLAALDDDEDFVPRPLAIAVAIIAGLACALVWVATKL